MTLDTGIKAWYFGSTKYVQAAFKNLEEYLRRKEKLLNMKGSDDLPKHYHSETDVLEELGAQETS